MFDVKIRQTKHKHAFANKINLLFLLFSSFFADFADGHLKYALKLLSRLFDAARTYLRSVCWLTE